MNLISNLWWIKWLTITTGWYKVTQWLTNCWKCVKNVSFVPGEPNHSIMALLCSLRGMFWSASYSSSKCYVCLMKTLQVETNKNSSVQTTSSFPLLLFFVLHLLPNCWMCTFSPFLLVIRGVDQQQLSARIQSSKVSPGQGAKVQHIFTTYAVEKWYF